MCEKDTIIRNFHFWCLKLSYKNMYKRAFRVEKMNENECWETRLTWTWASLQLNFVNCHQFSSTIPSSNSQCMKIIYFFSFSSSFLFYILLFFYSFKPHDDEKKKDSSTMISILLLFLTLPHKQKIYISTITTIWNTHHLLIIIMASQPMCFCFALIYFLWKMCSHI
jgi:hypothetical protein